MHCKHKCVYTLRTTNVVSLNFLEKKFVNFLYCRIISTFCLHLIYFYKDINATVSMKLLSIFLLLFQFIDYHVHVLENDCIRQMNCVQHMYRFLYSALKELSRKSYWVMKFKINGRYVRYKYMRFIYENACKKFILLPKCYNLIYTFYEKWTWIYVYEWDTSSILHPYYWCIFRKWYVTPIVVLFQEIWILCLRNIREIILNGSIWKLNYTYKSLEYKLIPCFFKFTE